ncbi:MAG: DUF3291 domain-containing protein [Pseudomonadota bacterium]
MKAGAHKHLAQFNIGRLRYPIQDVRNKDFCGGAEIVNRIAAQSPGSVWKYETAPGGAVLEVIDEDPMIVVNMTVWERIEDLRHFVWNKLHKRFYQRRAQWFSVILGSHSVMWWVAPGHRPSVVEGYERLACPRADGSPDEAFDWGHTGCGGSREMQCA